MYILIPTMMVSRYITLAGPSEWAVTNSLWAAMEFHDVRPDQVFILHESSVRLTAQKAALLVDSLLRGYGVEPSVKLHEFHHEDFISIGEKVAGLVSEGKKKGEVSVDITPGRKKHALATLLAADRQGADHIFAAFSKEANQLPSAHSQLVSALQRGAGPSLEVVIAGKAGAEDTAALIAT
ncbi:MAG: hypothetical protein LN417_09100, partial [Candidatus Thermoplasmatota archaeon]|nr:hypothetical protein [Candidatus Thermoplasmatota archaeon]